MRIDEFIQQPENKFDYDVIDDVTVFMRNDPVFYRKQYFPAIARIADMHTNGKPIDKAACLSKMIENALQAYCERFKVAELADEVFTNDDRQSIMDKVFSEEMEQIKQGEYK